ncbi:MAG: START-like domain-containing protein [Flavobacteriales bacterium]
MAEKTKLELEYLIRSSNKSLFNLISTPDGLSEWYADDVVIRNGEYFIVIDDEESKAVMKQGRTGDQVRYEFQDGSRVDTYLEFIIKTDPLTRENALLVTDFCEVEEEEESKKIWDFLIGKLKQRLGA